MNHKYIVNLFIAMIFFVATENVLWSLDIDKHLSDVKNILEKDPIGNNWLHILAAMPNIDIESKVHYMLSRHSSINDRGSMTVPAELINMENNNKLTPLHIAIRHKNNIGFLFLLKNGANIYAKNIDNITPLHIAAKYNNMLALESLTKMIANQGDSVNLLDSWSQNPLYYAVLHTNFQAALYLIKAGINSTHKDDAGMSVLLSWASINSSRSDAEDEFLKTLLSLPEGKALLTGVNKSQENIAHLIFKLPTVQALKPEQRTSEQISKLAALESAIEYADDSEKNLMKAYRGLFDKEDRIGRKPNDPIISKPGNITLKEDCGICREPFHWPLLITCGHIFCAPCLQAARPITNDQCPMCRKEIKLVNGYAPYCSATRELLKEEKKFDSAIKNLVDLGQKLGKNLTFDKNHTAALEVDNEFQVKMTFLDRYNKFFIYSPLVTFSNSSCDRNNTIDSCLHLGFDLKDRLISDYSIGYLRNKNSIVLSSILSHMSKRPKEYLSNNAQIHVREVKKLRGILQENKTTDLCQLTKEIRSIYCGGTLNDAAKDELEKLNTCRQEIKIKNTDILSRPIVSEGEFFESDNGSISFKWNFYDFPWNSLREGIAIIVKLPRVLSSDQEQAQQQKEDYLSFSVFGWKTSEGRIIQSDKSFWIAYVLNTNELTDILKKSLLERLKKNEPFAEKDAVQLIKEEIEKKVKACWPQIKSEERIVTHIEQVQTVEI